jgi:phage N-6-adenine-methyltransferase
MESKSWNNYLSVAPQTKSDWETPNDLFSALDSEFGFDLDACSVEGNKKCERFISPEIDSLSVNWWDFGSVIWCNPPYSARIGDWFAKAYEASLNNCTVVLLTFCRTDTKAFQQYLPLASEVRAIKGRLRFVGAESNSPMPSLLLIFHPNKSGPTILSTYDYKTQ